MSNGILTQISFKKESAWGTAVVPDKSIPVSFSGGIKTDNDIQTISAAKGNLAKNQDAFVGARKHEGEYEMELYPDYPGYYLLLALGSVLSALKAGETTVYQHDFTEVESKPSLTVEQGVGENVQRFAGVMCNSVKLSAKTGQPVKATFGLAAKSQSSATKITPAYLDSRAFNFSEAIVKIDGVQMPEVSSLELEYKNGLELKHALNGSNDPAFSALGGSEISGKMEIFLNSSSSAEITAYLNKTLRALTIEITGEAIGTASNNKLTVSMPKVFYKVAETKIVENENMISVEFEGVFDTATSKLLSMQLVNTLANYS